ncbi:MAG: ATP-binding protein [Deltaproteobacteria bacterium]|nr:ATP-binding protein [Deltaproteobacteria bacterium]
MKELVVISGKGGTGKTSLVASYAALAKNAVIVDCDVDAPDLHLVLAPTIERRERFIGGKQARIKAGHCIACGKCEELCRFDAVRFDGPGNGKQPRTFRVDALACEGCGVCAWFCAEKAIAFEPVARGEWYRSATRFGPLLHARLDAAAANSGKLVSTLREQARQVAAETGRGLVLIDGSPGIGCPVISSITGAAQVLVVSEPTRAGEHDLERVLTLARGFAIPAAICVNRADIDAGMADRIERRAAEAGALILPRVPFDRAVTEAQMQGRPVVEMRRSPAALEIEKGWEMLWQRMQ